MKKILFALLFVPVFAHAQIITTVAGNGTNGGTGDGGPATAANIALVEFMTFDKWGNLYLSDITLGKIRKVSAAGIITTVVGTGAIGNTGDSSAATNARLNAPGGLVCDNLGNLYIADQHNYRVRKVDVSTGIIYPFAGTGIELFAGSGDGGPATAAQFNTPCDLIFDKKGNLYVADNSASTVRKISPAGTITNFAGIGGSVGHSGDGGPATAAQLHDPRYLAIDDTGNIYIAEQIANRIRMVDTFGIIHTIAGTGVSGYNGDSISATSANLAPGGLAFFNNALYVSTIYDNHLRKIDLHNDTIYNIAGTGVQGYNGDGIPALTAQMYYPACLAVRECGSLYFSDADNSRIRKITYPPVYQVPSVTLSGISSSTTGSTVTVTATVANAGSSYLIHWMNHGIQFATTTVPTVSYTKLAGIDTITARVVSTELNGCYDSTTSQGHITNVVAGVSTVSASGRFTVYPNPAHNELHITGGDITSVTVSNLLGQVVYAREYSASQADIAVAGLPGGVYLVKINGSEVVRLLKQ